MNLLVTGAWQQATDYLKQLKKEHDVVFMQWENKKLPCEYEWVEGIVGNGIFLSHPIEKFKNLRYIQLTSAGYDRVPLDYVKEHGFKLPIEANYVNFADCIERCINDEKTYENLCIRAKEYYKVLLNWETWEKLFNDILKEVIK